MQLKNMKTLMHSIKFIVLGVVVALGASYIHAQTWNPAPSSPPSNNTIFPVNVSANDQVKLGGLSVNAFMANQNAQFDKVIYLQGPMHGGTVASVDSTIAFGGTDPVNNAINRVVNMYVTGGLKAANTIQSDTLRGLSVGELCANSSGVLIRCTSPSTNSYPTITHVQVLTEKPTPASPVNIRCSVTLATRMDYSTTYKVDFTFESTDIPDRHLDLSLSRGHCTVTIPTGNISGGVLVGPNASGGLHNYPGNTVLEDNMSANDYCVSSNSVPVTSSFRCQ